MNPRKSRRKGVEIPIAEEALARLAAIVENSSEAIIGRALDGTVVSWNAAAKRILGYTAAEVIGCDLVAYFPPELLHQITERRKIVRAGQAVPDHQSVRLTKDGRRIDVALSISPVRDHRGNIIGTATIMRDITERKRAEQLLALEHAVARCLADAGDASEALKAVIRAICETENWACGRYLRVDDKAAVLRFGEYWSVPDPVIQGLIEGSRGLTYGLGVALSGTVWQSGEPLWIADNTKDARAQTTVFGVESGMRGAFAFPVKSEGETIGVFVFNSREVREPDTRLLAAIRVIGSQIGQFLRRKRVEAERIRLTAIVENSNDAIISRALDGTIQSWNAGAERLFGYAAAEAIGRSATFIMPPDRQSDLARDTEKLLRGEVIAPLESKRMTKDGRALDVLVSRSPIKDDAGNIVGISVIFHDISAIKQAEAAMKINEERFRATFEQAAVGIAHTTSDRQFLAVNQKYCDMLGYTRDELLAMYSNQTLHPDDQDASVDMERLLAGEIDTYSGDRRYIRKDGSILWVNRTVSLARDGSRKPLYFIRVIEDITERKRAEETLNQSLLRVHALSERAMKIQQEERDGIARELHDELGQTLTALKVNLQMLEPFCTRGEAEGHLTEALMIVGRALEQVRGMMLDLRPPELDDLGLTAALESHFAKQAEAAEWISHFETLAPPGRLRSELEMACFRVAQEALTNVMRHAQANEVWVVLGLKGKEVELSVRDDGIGFDAAAVSDHPSASSFGLIGMRERVRQMGGRLTIRSAVGCGTEVRARFPCAAVGSQALEANASTHA